MTLALAGASSADKARLAHTIEALSSHGSRLAGYAGDRYAADLVERELRAAGVTRVQREPFSVVVPIERGALLELPEEGEKIVLHSLWPDLVRTSTTGPQGIEAMLFYGGDGEYASFDGFEVEDHIVLLEFNTGARWKNAAALGARAVIFVEPEETTLFEARQKWSWAPLDLPRFWLERGQALKLREKLARGPLRARIEARMDWEERRSWNIWGLVPGTDPRLADQLVVVQTYYDGISVVPALNPAAESAVGIAVLLEWAHYLKEHPPGRPVALVATGAHFLGRDGLTAFLNRHARKKALFRGRMPQRFVADSLKVEKLAAAGAKRGLSPDSLGIYLRAGRLDSLDLGKLLAQLKLRRLQADSLGVRLEPDSLGIALFVALDLSSHSDQVGVLHSARAPEHQRFFVPVGRAFARHARSAARALERDPAAAFVNLISPGRGMSRESFVQGEVFVEDGIKARNAGLMALNLLTLNDSRLALDTPLDRAARVDLASVQRQSEFINRLLHAVLGDPALYGPEAAELRRLHDKNITDVLVDISGQLRLLPRRSATPDLPVPGGLVVLQPRFDLPWRPRLYIADAQGEYQARGLTRQPPIRVQAFVLDKESGAITYATDLGARAQAIGQVEQSLAKDETMWTTVLFAARARAIHERIHAHFFSPYGALDGNLQVLDKRGAQPRQYGYALGDRDEQMMVLFGAAGDSLRLIDRSLILLNNAGATDEHSALGAGFAPGADRLIRRATLQAARDMWRLDEVRIERMRRFAIENPRLQGLHERAKLLIDRAEKARRARQWAAYIQWAREGLGLEYRAYPEVRATQNDVVAGLVFFVALLVPAAFFGERLLFAASDIRRQLALFGLILLAIWVVLSQVHPAFELAHPVIILLALIVMGMAFFVIALIAGRFNTFMADLRSRQAGAMRRELSRSGAAYVAFMLGISNLRRRVLRTALTLGTITILTFTVLSFTSFEPGIRFVGFEKDWKPTYYGLMLHELNWREGTQALYDYIYSHFGDHGTVVPRTWLLGGTASEAFVPLRRGARRAAAAGLVGLSPDEARVTGVDRALVAGSFFESETEKSVILPEPMAAQLGLGRADVGRAQVRIFGKEWRLRALYDAGAFAAIKDLNNRPLAPARVKSGAAMMPGMDQLLPDTELLSGDFDLDLGFEYLEPGRLAILPYGQLASMGARPMSVAVAFDEGAEGEALVKSFLTRARFRLFASLPDEEGRLRTYVYTSLGATRIEGLGALFVPLLIAALIVLNTMMGAVYERFREIGVYSSVGLAPVHIAFLFIAEACVYGVLGTTTGYVIGQVGARVLRALDLLGGVSLNYSSTAAISSALLVLGVVLLSTLYPARVASTLAVPDVVRRWQLPEPEGDRWRFPFPFTVNRSAVYSLCGYLHAFFVSYGHESVGKLYSEKTRIVVEEEKGERVYAVQLLLWLAPFDMGVSQYLQFTLRPARAENIYDIELYIERISGPLAFWRRLNLGFMLRLRQQFLVWQTLRAELLEDYGRRARRLALDAGRPEAPQGGRG